MFCDKIADLSPFRGKSVLKLTYVRTIHIGVLIALGFYDFAGLSESGNRKIPSSLD